MHHTAPAPHRTDPNTPGATESTRASGRRKSRRRLARTGFVIAAGVSFLFSVSLWFSGYKSEGLFVGLWVPSILSLGNLIMGGSRDE